MRSPRTFKPSPARVRWNAARAAYRLAHREAEQYHRDHVEPASRRLVEIRAEEGEQSPRCRSAEEVYDQTERHFGQLANVEQQALTWLIGVSAPWKDAVSEKIGLIIEHRRWTIDGFSDVLRGLQRDVQDIREMRSR